MDKENRKEAEEAATQAKGRERRIARQETSRVRAENESLKQEIDRLKGEVEQLDDKWKRAVAELENYKKRAARDREEWRKYANENLLSEILLIVDNIERALDHAQNQTNAESDAEALLEGIRMIHRQFVSTLERFGVRPIEALNQPFDPSVHEAMMDVESDELEPNTVAQELQRGYLLHDRLLRAAKVAVSKQTESR